MDDYLGKSFCETNFFNIQMLQQLLLAQHKW